MTQAARFRELLRHDGMPVRRALLISLIDHPIRSWRRKMTQFGPIEIEKALNLDGTEGLRRAPRPMKMGTTALPWRYDAAARRCDPAG